MRAEAKGDMTTPSPGRVEALRVCPARAVPVRRGDDQEYLAASVDRLAVELDGPVGNPLHQVERRVEAQSLLHDRFDVDCATAESFA